MSEVFMRTTIAGTHKGCGGDIVETPLDQFFCTKCGKFEDEL